MTTSGIRSGDAPGSTSLIRYIGPPPSLSSSAGRGVRPHDHAAQRTLGCELERDLRGDDLRDHARQLVGGTPPEDEVLPLVVGWQVAELAAEELAVDVVEVEQTVVRVDAAELVAPGGAQRLHGVGVAVEVDDRFWSAGRCRRRGR